jgi:hypothetical protein
METAAWIGSAPHKAIEKRQSPVKKACIADAFSDLYCMDRLPLDFIYHLSCILRNK